MGHDDRPAHRHGGRAPAALQAPSRAGVSGLPRALEPQPRIRRGAPGGRQRTGRASGQPDAQERQVDPGERPGSAPLEHRSARTRVTAARQRARAGLLPLTNPITDPPTEKPMLTNPTIETLKSLKLHGMIEALEEQQQSPVIQALSLEERLALIVDRERLYRDNTSEENTSELQSLTHLL